MADAVPYVPRQYVGPDGSVVKAADASEADAYASLGYAHANEAQIAHSKLVEDFSNPIYGAALGVIRTIPGLQTGILGAARYLGGDATAQDFATKLDATAEASPYATALAQAGGTLALGAATGGGAVGLSAGAGLATRVAAVAGEGAVIGALTKTDEAALKYAATGEGVEKLYQNLGAGALEGMTLNTLVGIALPSAFRALKGKAGQAAQGLTDYANKMDTDQLLTKTAQDVLARRGVLDTVSQFAKEHKLTKFKDPAELKQYLKDQQAVADSLFKDVRFSTDAALGLNEQAVLNKGLHDIYKGADASVHAEINRFVNQAEFGASPRNLQNLRKELNKKFGAFDDPTSSVGAMTRKADQLLTGHIETLLSSSPDETLMAKWQKANRTYAAATNLLNYGGGTDGRGILRAVTIGFGGAAGAKVGYGVGGGVGAAVGGAIGGGLGAVGNQAARAAGKAALKGLASTFRSVDSRNANAVLSWLQKGAATEAITHSLIPRSAFDQVQAVVQDSQTNPQGHVSRLSETLDKQGIPGPVADALIGKHTQVMAYLNEARPASPFAGQTVAPEAFKPTVRQQNAFMEKVNAVMNPSEALQNPTPAKIEALKAVFPESTDRIVQAVSSHAAQTPNLSRRARNYTSHLNGLAPSGVRTPQVQVGLSLLLQKAKMRAMQAAQMQGSAAPPSAGGASSASVNSAYGASRVERLSN